ncbi:hypothetical protein, partial [Burkholderia pseudomallei]
VNRLFFMTSFSPLEAILSSFNWSENSRAGHDCIHVLLTDAWAKESSPRLLRQRDESHERAFNGGSLGFRLLPNYRYSYGDHATAS